jgi:hypothetical protein
MSLHRNEFLESLAKESVLLNTVFLNHSGSPTKLQTDLSSIDLLADKNASTAFLKFCQRHPLVTKIKIFPQFRRKKVQLTFKDGSELNLKLIRNMVKKSLLCLPVSDIISSSMVNDYGMLVPSHPHHYEYLLLKNQFVGLAFPDRYQKYFSAMDFNTRTAIFRHIQPKYNLVLNTIEELYKPKASTRLKLMIGLRRLKVNTLSKMFIRAMEFFLFTFVRKFSKDAYTLSVDQLNPHQHSREEKPPSSRQVVL